MLKTKNNSNQMIEWKNKVIAAKEAKERRKRATINQSIGSKALYNVAVEDAVKLILTKITRQAEDGTALYTEKDGVVTLGFHKAFVITADLKLQLDPVDKIMKSDKQCFYYSYQFNSEKEVQKYLKDVKSKLPQEVSIIAHRRDGIDGIYTNSRIFSVQVAIDLNN